jgi:hypothetical protein
MPSRSLSRGHLGLLLGFIGMAIFGGSLPATRVAVAGLCSLALLIVLRRPLPPRRLWFQLAIASLCVSIGFPFLMALAVQTVNASHGGVVMGALPIATAFVAVLITHERPRPLFWIASIASAALVVAFALRQGGGALSSGDLLLFAAGAASAIGYVFSGRLTADAGMGQLGAGGSAADLAASGHADHAAGPGPHRVHTMAGAALRRVVLTIDRILRVECRHGDGRHCPGVADAVAAAVRNLGSGRTVQRRDDHAADCAVRRGRGCYLRDLDARAASRAQHLGPDAAPRRRTYSAAETRANSVACRSNNPR